MIGTTAISSILPHRYPMLLVDRVTAVVPGETLTALKGLTCNEPWFHTSNAVESPQSDAFPYVLMIESWCQAAGILAAWEAPNADVLTGNVMLFGGVSGIRFHGLAFPGEVLEHRVRLVRALADVAIFEGETLVGDATIMEVERVVMAQRPAETLRRAGADGRDGGTKAQVEEVGHVG